QNSPQNLLLSPERLRIDTPVADLVNLIYNQRLLLAEDGIVEGYIVHLLAIHPEGLQHNLKEIAVDILHKQLGAEAHLGVWIRKQRKKGIHQHILYQQFRG